MERRVCALLVGAALVLAAGCSTVQTTATYDQKADFASYRTFSWFRTEALPDDGWTPRLAVIVRDGLAGRGLREVETDSDLWAVTGLRFSWGPVGSPGEPIPVPDGYGGEPGSASTGVSPKGEPPVLTVSLDLVDARRRLMVFRGMGSRSVKPEEARGEREKVLREIVAELLKKYPAKGR